MTLCYMAHAYGGNPENLARAQRWLRYLNRKHFPVNVFVAPWIEWCIAVPETPENRAAGLAMDIAEVARCDAIWLVGGRISDGMRTEMAHAKVVVDLTHLGDEPPSV